MTSHPVPARSTQKTAAAPERLVIDCHALYQRVYRTPDGMRAVQAWLRANSINPDDLPVHSELVIENSAFGMVIRYETYRINEDGRRYVDPNDPDRAATENRTALLQLPPPADWMALTEGEQRTASASSRRSPGRRAAPWHV
ncbi:hypothetical protein JL475_24440 [Streptomyces sp. M2CJ-2]|uniref:hypothetical protein n=1 Tax=Streptomyces sp. M2CJ-2 TaxID=2803948 RepID=UPI0019290EF9|nr:hypothetical protein [Streptomyces sp. M2CJ-2]MBL3669085.1 hypothetical protein [Streptomyces sp. M2CJ-2]